MAKTKETITRARVVKELKANGSAQAVKIYGTHIAQSPTNIVPSPITSEMAELSNSITAPIETIQLPDGQKDYRHVCIP